MNTAPREFTENVGLKMQKEDLDKKLWKLVYKI